MREEVSSTMIYCKNFCKCQMYPPQDNDVLIKKKKIESIESFFLIFILFICAYNVWVISPPPLILNVSLQYWGLNSGPTPLVTPPALFCEGFFQDRVLLQTMILLISAS
jgi:hypothetical protein